MNFVAIIGIVKNKDKQVGKTILNVKVEKPRLEGLDGELWYDIVTVEANNKQFSYILKTLDIDDVVGIKGRIESGNKLIVERIQLF